MTELLNIDALRPKVKNCINRYLSLSNKQSLTIGFYCGGKLFVLSNEAEHYTLIYGIGSISKTLTAHLILSLADKGLLELDKSISDYIELPDGEYPTLYALLTHTAGYGHLTPAEITVPSLLKHGYARKNLYENCTSDTVIRCLSRRKDGKIHGYSYSDFPYALLAIAAENITGKCFSELFEDFIKNELGMSATFITPPKHMHLPPSMKGHRAIAPWIWKRENPYIAGGGLYCSIDDILKYISIQIESDKPYITSAHKLCESSVSPNRNIATCIGWHTYKKSNQLWHVGGVGTFRSSVIFNRKRKIGVAVLGNSKGIASANVHYLAKMLYSEMKIRKIDFKKFTKGAEYDTPRNK